MINIMIYNISYIRQGNHCYAVKGSLVEMFLQNILLNKFTINIQFEMTS